MMTGPATIFFLLLGSAVALRSSSSVTPVEKVISLLDKLSVQVSEEGKKEAAEYDKFACFCKEQADEKQYQIEKSTKRISKLNATINDLDAEISDLNSDISTLTTRIGEIKAAVSYEEGNRSEAHGNYTIKEQNVSGAIDAVEKAIEAMKDSKKDMEGAKLDLVQLKKKLEAAGAPVFEYQSNDIIATLKSLKLQFIENKNNLDQTEFDARSTSEKKVLGLNNEKKFKKEDKEEKEQVASRKSEEKFEATEDKTAETDAKTSDESFLDELTTQCGDRATEWDQRSTSRAAELTAMSEAIDILKKTVKGKYDANKKLVDLQKPISFLQTSSHGRAAAAALKSVLNTLDSAAERLHSPLLSALSLKASLSQGRTAADHFVKVRGIISDLVAKLQQQALDEATAKGTCDTQMAAAISKRDSNALLKETHSATISVKSSKIAKLTNEIAELSQAIADLKKALNEATDLRKEEKKENTFTIDEATDGKTAVNSAITVLQNYYDSQGGTFIQSQYKPPKSDRSGKTVGDRAPEMSYDGDYEGKTNAKGGVLGLLNVILSDFERTITTVTAEEADAVTKFNSFKTTTDNDVNSKDGDITTKEGQKDTAESDLTDAEDDLSDADGLHITALDELEKLKAQCVDGEESYAERVQKRKDEIEALKSAMKILDEWQD